MPMGPGKYDDLATYVRKHSLAKTAIVIVLEGYIGNGFSVQSTDAKISARLPALLRLMADDIERDMP